MSITSTCEGREKYWRSHKVKNAAEQRGQPAWQVGQVITCKMLPPLSVSPLFMSPSTRKCVGKRNMMSDSKQIHQLKLFVHEASNFWSLFLPNFHSFTKDYCSSHYSELTRPIFKSLLWLDDGTLLFDILALSWMLFKDLNLDKIFKHLTVTLTLAMIFLSNVFDSFFESML